MNPVDAPFLPVLAALNIHPLRRRQGLLVQRVEVKKALRDLKLGSHPLPEGRLIDAHDVDKILVDSGISVNLVQRRTSEYISTLRKT